MNPTLHANRPKSHRWVQTHRWARTFLATTRLALLPILPCWGLAFVLAQSAQAQEPEAEIRFGQDVQPLFARRCFACHGPDTAEAGLRLNAFEPATAKLESGLQAIAPGAPDQSELLKRIRSTEEGHRMPPEGKPLTEREQKIIETWIAQGAQWKQHWAFEPLTKPEVPQNTLPQNKLATQSASKHPIDAFVDQKLAKRGLSRAAQGEPLELLRRLYYDLIGLPPTPAQATAFIEKTQSGFEQAWEAEIDRLLATEQYGERWARHWLDVVRYGETNSFERDGAKPHVWRYRDYVIRALNQDKPYNEFLTEQLAGDELPEITRDSLIATGFYRLGIWDDEPADRELAVYEGFDDILTTVGQGILGLTINCSRCHDHKIDPIPTKDYYSTLAFFRNLTSNGYGPQVERPLIASQADKDQMRNLEQEIRETADRIQKRLTQVESSLRDQFNELTKSESSSYDLDDLESKFYRDTWDLLPNFDELKPETIAKVDPPLIDIGASSRPDFFGFVFNAMLIVPKDGEYTFILDSDDGSRLSLDGKQIIEYDGIHGVGSPKRASVQLKQGRVPLRLDYFQRQFGKGLNLSWSGPGFRRKRLTVDSGEQAKDLQQAIANAKVDGLEPTLVEEFKSLRKQLEENKRRKPWEDYGMCVSEAGTNAPDTFVLTRGSPQGKADKVDPAFLSILGGEPPAILPNPQANTTGRRLAFAKWITDPNNRLTSRVFVNRIWQHHFGRGIVRSPNNFGQLGEQPTHPELLDWLASNFVEQGWRIKPLHKLILTSQSYRQSALASPEALAKDANNDWFSRFDLRRLSAEELRDSILAVNGKLNLQMYGPSIYPTLSKEVLASQSVPGKGWERSGPEDQTRRSVYIHIKRSLLVPMLSNFDFPDPDVSCEARFITTQPGQALGMLNSDFLHSQSEEFAKRLQAQAPEDLDGQIRLAHQLAIARSPSADEVARSKKLIEQLQTKHQLSPDKALAFFCLYVYNLNEFSYID
ncbi:MAG: DUF1553 domain-containing protein [Planctomycetota bacterium]|nr:DUF1553 domain-containing protein [Planctomycetota bacterium]